MVKKDLFKKAISMVLTVVLGCTLFSNICSASAERSVSRRGPIRLDSTTIVHLPSLKRTDSQPNNTQQNNISSNKKDNDGEYTPDEKTVKEEEKQEEEDFQRMIEDILK